MNWVYDARSLFVPPNRHSMFDLVNITQSLFLPGTFPGTLFRLDQPGSQGISIWGNKPMRAWRAGKRASHCSTAAPDAEIQRGFFSSPSGVASAFTVRRIPELVDSLRINIKKKYCQPPKKG